MGNMLYQVFIIMGIIIIALLINISLPLRRNRQVKKRPRGMSAKELMYQRSRYLYHARHFRRESSTKKA